MTSMNFTKFYQNYETKVSNKDNLIEKYKNMNEYPDFEQNYFSLTAKVI